MRHTTIKWTEQGVQRSALWRSERGAAPPQRVQIADDSTPADTAYRLACEGVGLLWRGDFQNARHLIQALERRLDRTNDKPLRKKKSAASAPVQPLENAFHVHRQIQAQRARILGMVLLPIQSDYTIALRRAPNPVDACTQAWGIPTKALENTVDGAQPVIDSSVCSLRELLGIVSAYEWRKKGVKVPALGSDRMGLPVHIYPHYGVFSPIRGEYIDLVLKAPLPVMLGKPAGLLAFDIGTGTGVLAAVLARRGVGKVVATDQDPRALACATDNFDRMQAAGITQAGNVQAVEAHLFPDVQTHGRAHLIVCNPPWLPARPGSPLEHAVYDEGSQMLLGFLKCLPAHMAPGAEAWLILSDLAEHLGLRTRQELLQAIQSAGLRVVARMDTKPRHPKAADTGDALFVARSREVTSLWRLTRA